MNICYNHKTGKWEKAKPIPYQKPCLPKRIIAKVLWLCLGRWLKEKHHDSVQG